MNHDKKKPEVNCWSVQFQRALLLFKHYLALFLGYMPHRFLMLSRQFLEYIIRECSCIVLGQINCFESLWGCMFSEPVDCHAKGATLEATECLAIKGGGVSRVTFRENVGILYAKW